MESVMEKMGLTAVLTWVGKKEGVKIDRSIIWKLGVVFTTLFPMFDTTKM